MGYIGRSADSDLQSAVAGDQRGRHGYPPAFSRQCSSQEPVQPGLDQKALGVFQGERMLIAPNNGAAPGTAAYVANNYLETSGTQIYPVNK